MNDFRNPDTAHVVPRPYQLLILLLILIGIWFGGLDHRKLIKPDEGRYAEISREMAVSGDWVTPRLNALKYFEKPPLQYWATAAAYRVFGTSEWTARLWTALTGFFGVLLAAFTAGRLYGRKTALYTAAILASNLLYVLLGHINALDMALSFFMSGTLFCALLARHSQQQKMQTSWVLAAWAAMAFAVLSKGLIGIVLPGAVLFVYLFLSRDWVLLKMLNVIRGGLLFLAITAPWFVLVSLRNPEFPHFFFIHEHFERFLTTEHRREGAWWYFLPILAMGLLPWLTFTFTALLSSLKAQYMGQQTYIEHTGFSGGRFKPELMLLIWSLLIFVFFSLSGSKLPSYILPIFPALALLTAIQLSRIKRKAMLWHLGLLGLIAVATSVAVLRLHLFDAFADENNQPSPAYLSYQQWILSCLLFWIAGLIGSLLACWRQRLSLALIGLALTSLLTWTGILLGHEQLRGTTSAYDLAQAVKSELSSKFRQAPNAPFYSIGMYDQTLNFYLNRTVTLVNHRDEMDFGLTQEPDKGIPDIAAFVPRWNQDAQAFAIMPPDVFAKLQQVELPLRVVFKDTNRIVIAKPETRSETPSPQKNQEN